MNSDSIQNNEPNRNQVINPFLAANTSIRQLHNFQNINSSLNPSPMTIIQDNQEIKKDSNTPKIFEQKNYDINTIPFNSLLNQAHPQIISSSKNLNNISNINNISSTTVNNPFSNSSTINNTTILNSFDYNPNNNRTYKIELFKSKNKSKESPNNVPSNNNNVQVITLKNGKSENYKILIKRISLQLKKKIKKPTKGFFYCYINKEKEKEYRILVKKIAIQLKKRIKFPTCKILHIYESYIILIKRIAFQLKESIEKKRNQTKIEEGGISNVNIPMENIEENKRIINEISQSSSKKNLNYDITLLKRSKEEEENKLKLKLSEEKRKGEINNNESDNIRNTGSKIEDLNKILTQIEVDNNNFNEEFKKFLEEANISIINDLPVLLTEKNKLLFQQNNFWYLYFNYIFSQKNNLTMYTILSLLEQYFIWCKDNSLQNFTSIKELLKKYISSNFTQEKLQQFLFMNKLSNINDIFLKYEMSIKNNHKDYHEIKLNAINISNNSNICDCELCISDDACIKKVVDMNKEKIKITQGENIDYIGIKDSTNKNERSMDIDNGEELYFKGVSNKKNKNNIFTESKTRLSENTSFVYTSIKSNNNIINKIDSEEKDKTYKNISIKRPKISEEKNSSEKKRRKGRRIKRRKRRNKD